MSRNGSGVITRTTSSVWRRPDVANGLHGAVDRQDAILSSRYLLAMSCPARGASWKGSMCARAGTEELRNRPLAVHSANATEGFR